MSESDQGSDRGSAHLAAEQDPVHPLPLTIGLTTDEAARRLAVDGSNQLPHRRGRPWPIVLLGQFTHFFAALLWAAAGLALVAGIAALAIAVVTVIVFNGVFAFAQEHRADQAAARLRALLPRRTTVYRDGSPTEIDADRLVTGDVVVLAAGDRVSADLEVLEAHGLELDTSLLTGESVPEPIATGAAAPAGCFIVEGEGTALVRATGARTKLAAIAELATHAERPRSPLNRELHSVVITIAVVALSIGVVFFGVSLALGADPGDGFIFAIGITVALVPEGLLPTVSLSLAIGAQRMAGRNALVRRLEAVETLGSTTFVCTDKTGTLTRNEMAVVDVWTPAGSVEVRGVGYDPTGELVAPSSRRGIGSTGDAGPGIAVAPTPALVEAVRELATVARRCSTGRAVFDGDAWVARGDPMEAALDVLARRVGAGEHLVADAGHAGEADPGPTAEQPERWRLPFDPRRRRMSVATRDRLLVKGAPDAVLDRCTATSRDAIDDAEAAVEAMSRRGLRVLAVAARSLTDADVERPDPDSAEQHLALLGLVGLEDPPRADAAEAVAACRAAGVSMAMVTGDHPATALAVAREVGLWQDGAPVRTGDALPTDDAELGELLDTDGAVVARVSPQDKLRILRALQARGHVVAMTGDGVNDAPALQEADIGVAMGKGGTDVAREAADLVLLDDHFGTIVAAMHQGRATYAGIQRFLTYHLTDNVAEVAPFLLWGLSGGSIPLALTVLQILALDIGTDTLSAVALGAEAPSEWVATRGPARGRLFDRTVTRRAFGVLGPTEVAVELGAFVAVLVAGGWRFGAEPAAAVLQMASGAAFLAVVVGQSANAFACRSASRWPGALGWCSNPLLIGAVAVGLAFALASLAIPAFADWLDHAPPTALGVGVALLAFPAVLGVDALDKAVRARSS